MVALLKDTSHLYYDGSSLSAQALTALRKREEELEAARVEQAQATQTAALLQAEVERLRAEGQKAVENLTAWVERATKAETKLEALERETNEAGRRDE